MPKSTLAGHPLHPMLIVAPAALIPFGLVLDAMHRATGKESYSNAAYYSLAGALVGGVAAATAGVMDYLAVPPETDVKRTANVHAALNSGALALTAVNLASRKNKPDHEGGSLLLSALATIGVLVSGWFGGRMVYEQGMRVKGVSPIESAPEAELLGEERIAHAAFELEKHVPAGGSVLRH